VLLRGQRLSPADYVRFPSGVRIIGGRRSAVSDGQSGRCPKAGRTVGRGVATCTWRHSPIPPSRLQWTSWAWPTCTVAGVRPAIDKQTPDILNAESTTSRDARRFLRFHGPAGLETPAMFDVRLIRRVQPSRGVWRDVVWSERFR